MGQYRIDSIARLARQMRFAPIARRLQQLHAAEDLLLQLRPDQTCAIGEVTVAITGYEPKQSDNALLTGVALQHDLGMLVEEVSESLQLDVKAVPEPVLMIEEVVQRLGVTSKTVQRWRRRGLPAGHYTFADGKRRVGFRLSHVRRFTQGAPAEERPATVSGRQRDTEWLLRRATELARAGYWRMLAAERLAKAAGVAAPALDRLLAEHGGQIPFAPEPDLPQRRMMLELAETGESLGTIAAKTALPKFGVYRAVVDRKLTRAIRKKIQFIDDSIYHLENAAGVIEQIIAQEPVAQPLPAVELERVPRELPPYLRDLYRIPLLHPARERGLFLKYQYLRFRAAETQQALDLQSSRNRDLRRLKSLQLQARLVRGQIVEANLRLVVSVARKHVRPGLSLMELVSEGNLILIRAAGSFDVHRGTRFSTYAIYALMRGFARYVPAALQRLSGMADPALLAELHDPASTRELHHADVRDEVSRLIARLDERERHVITYRYGLEESPLTCEQLGTLMQISRQRITQIEQQAMEKLRADTGADVVAK